MKDESVPIQAQVVSIRDGRQIAVRPVRAADRHFLVEGLERLSPRSRWLRFMRPVSRLSEQDLTYLTELDYSDHFAWGALSVDDPLVGIGVARYVRDRRHRDVAEFAMVIIDDWQGRGVGTALLSLLAQSAVSNGIGVFRGYVSPDNAPMRSLLSGLGATGRMEGGLWVCEIQLPNPHLSLHGSPLGDAFIAATGGDSAAEPAAGDPL
jgi:RimJ/RimL family protein N-acetyltransferase